MKFKIEGTTADKRLVAFGENLEELFQNAAIGMFSEIAGLEDIKETGSRKIQIEGAGDIEDLLVDWLNELLYYYECDGFAAKRFEIKTLTKDFLEANVYGGVALENQIRGEIKAATYHELEILEKEEYLEARVILDV